MKELQALDVLYGACHTPVSCADLFPQAESWIAASQDSHVRKYDAANDSFAGLITRSPGVSIRAVTFSPDGNRIAVASEFVYWSSPAKPYL